MGLASVQKKLVYQQTSGIFSAVRKHNGLMGWHHNSNYPYSYRSGTTWCHAKFFNNAPPSGSFVPWEHTNSKSRSTSKSKETSADNSEIFVLLFYLLGDAIVLYRNNITFFHKVRLNRNRIEKDNIFLLWRAESFSWKGKILKVSK